MLYILFAWSIDWYALLWIICSILYWCLPKYLIWLPVQHSCDLLESLLDSIWFEYEFITLFGVLLNINNAHFSCLMSSSHCIILDISNLSHSLPKLVVRCRKLRMFFFFKKKMSTTINGLICVEMVNCIWSENVSSVTWRKFSLHVSKWCINFIDKISMKHFVSEMISQHTWLYCNVQLTRRLTCFVSAWNV